MKGVVLAGGTGSRLFPADAGHQQAPHAGPRPAHDLLPAADAGRAWASARSWSSSAVAASVTSWSCSPTAHDFGLDLTYRYQRGSLGIAHAIGLCRDFVGDDRFCVVLGDNILRGEPLAEWPRSSRPGPWGARHAALSRARIPSASAWPSSTLTATSSASRRSPSEPKSDSIPIGVYFLRPGCLRRHRAPRAVRSRRVRDHRRAQPLRRRAAASSRRHYEGHWADAGTIESLLEAGVMAAHDGDPGAQGHARTQRPRRCDGPGPA